MINNMILPLLLVTARIVKIEKYQARILTVLWFGGEGLWLASSLPDRSHQNHMGTVRPVHLLSRQENLDSYG